MIIGGEVKTCVTTPVASAFVKPCGLQNSTDTVPLRARRPCDRLRRLIGRLLRAHDPHVAEHVGPARDEGRAHHVLVVDEAVLGPELDLGGVVVDDAGVVGLARGAGAGEAGVELPRRAVVRDARDDREEGRRLLLDPDEDVARHVAALAEREVHLPVVHDGEAAVEADDAPHVDGRQQEPPALGHGHHADRLLEEGHRLGVRLEVLLGLVGHDDLLAALALEFHRKTSIVAGLVAGTWFTTRPKSAEYLTPD